MTTQTSLFNASIESPIQILSPLNQSSENCLDLPTLDFESTLSRQNPLSFQVHRTFAYLADLQKNPISSKDMSLALTASINTQVQALQVFEKSRQTHSLLPFHKLEEELKAPPVSNNLPDVPLIIPPLLF